MLRQTLTAACAGLTHLYTVRRIVVIVGVLYLWSLIDLLLLIDAELARAHIDQ